MPIPEPIYLTGKNLAFDEASAMVARPLAEHARTMAQGVYQVAERFYVAVGYGNANMTMVDGADGVILIDSLENAEAAREALADLRRFSDKPVRALIYTHSHPDHSSGSRGLIDPADIERGHVEIYAHERLLAGMRGNPSLGIINPARLAYSFGWGLERGADGLVEVGLGPLLRAGTTGFLPPTMTFRESLDIEVAGIHVQMHAAPSESDDEIVLWFPDGRVLHSADVIQGECLANLYALRGAIRDIWQWIGAVDLLRGFNAQALIFGHGRPLTGRDDVRETLTAYRDAMQYIHDQTVRLMARGLTPDELVEAVSELPPRLRGHPRFGEFYGPVTQIVRQVYASTFGWFEGDPTFIDPLPRGERSERYVNAMGGRDAVVAAAEQAHAGGDYRWTAEILTHLLRMAPDDRQARELKADALRQLGYQASNPIWRNNYLVAAKELDGTLDQAGIVATIRSLANPDVAATMSIPLLLRALATRLNPARSEGLYIHAGFHCTDSGASYGFAVRSDVADALAEAPAGASLVIETTEPALRSLLAGRVAWQRAVEDGAATLTSGSEEDVERFWSVFDPPMGELPAIALR
ncbi:MAG TPA: alkyl sulfatase dimerization domain-containing protein [Thermomicrobiales bacterium]|nr:alkyl sulfatase dimerization domain-containing protein [Thermomicrobiales bacterium]